MELFNGCIYETEELLRSSSAKKWAYDPTACWPETSRNELIMLREAAYELGGSAKSAVAFSCFTTNERLVGPDEVWLYGPDLSEIRGDCAFARIVLFSIQDVGEEDEAYRALQDIEFVKYHVFPKGYMIRALSEDNREQVRVSRAAIRDGISFRNVGFDYIRRFREKENVRSVRVIFVTAPEADYAALRANARKVSDITRSLSTILDGIPTDCDSCGLREICDEVEGMRELHFQQAGSSLRRKNKKASTEEAPCVI